jgi:hypothetical protein
MRSRVPADRPTEEIASAQAQARRKRLASLVPLWPRDLDDTSRRGRMKLIAQLERALRAERRRGLAGHWTYDLARHMQLLEAYRVEVQALRHIDAKTKTAPEA